jgi:hypothetical protein
LLEVFSCFYGLLPLGLNHPLQGPHLGLSKSMFLNHLEETLASLAGLEISLSHSEAHGPVACIGERAGSEVHKPTHRYVIVETVENCGRQPAAFLGDFGEPIFGRSFSLCCVLVPPNILIRHIIYVSCVQGKSQLGHRSTGSWLDSSSPDGSRSGPECPPCEAHGSPGG